MKVKFDSIQLGKFLFVFYCLLLIPLIAMMIKTNNDLNQLVMNPSFSSAEKIRSDFPKIIFIISLVFIIGVGTISSLFFYLRRDRNYLELDDSLDDITESYGLGTEVKEQKSESSILDNLIEKSVINSENINLTNILNGLCKQINAGLGLIYLTKTESEIEYLEFHSGYAIHKPATTSSKILFGEGLTGQAAASKNSILIKDISDKSLQIYSGLGTSPPTSLLICPIIKGENVLGVIEIGGFKNFNTSTQSQLEEVANYLSIKI